MASLSVGGSLLLLHGVTRLGMEVLGSLWFVKLGYSSSLAWCVLVDPFITAAGCGFEYAVGWCLSFVAGSRKVLLAGLRGGHLCRLSGHVLCLLTFGPPFAVPVLSSYLFLFEVYDSRWLS